MSPTLNIQTQSYLEAFVVDNFANIKGSKSVYIKNCKKNIYHVTDQISFHTFSRFNIKFNNHCLKLPVLIPL